MKKNHIFTSLAALSFCVISSTSLAKMLNLYDQPKADAKVIGSINTDTGIIPIFTPKDGVWIKVGDPGNGNVGWVKQSDLQSSTGVSYLQNVISTGPGVNSYKVIQIPSQPQMTPAETQAIIKRVQESQQAVQQAVQNMMQNMFNYPGSSYPVMVPIIVVPENNSPTMATPPVKQK